MLKRSITSIICISLLVPTPSWAKDLFIPPIYELQNDIEKQNECNRALQIDNCLQLVEIGMIEPGVIDLDHPNVRFQLAYNRWLKLWNIAARQNMVDYQEVLAFERVVKAFEKFVDRVEKERKGER